MLQILMWQTIEWQVMLFIIYFEKNMTLFELTYLQENTQKFQKKERRQFYAIAILYIIFSMLIFIGSLSQYIILSTQNDSYLDHFEYGFLATEIPITLLIACSLIILLNLTYQMFVRH